MCPQTLKNLNQRPDELGAYLHRNFQSYTKHNTVKYQDFCVWTSLVVIVTTNWLSAKECAKGISE